MLSAVLSLVLILHMTSSQVVVIGNKGASLNTVVVKEDFPQNSVSMKCMPSQMCVTMNRTWLADTWAVVDGEDLSFNQPCAHSRRVNDTHIIVCTEAYKMTSCGTAFNLNDSHVIYSNNVTMREPVSGLGGSFIYRRVFSWRCIYPVQILVGLQFIPVISPVTQFLGSTTGKGTFKAAMFMYKDSTYTDMYELPPVLKMDDRIRVRVQLLQAPNYSRIQVFKCWGSPDLVITQYSPQYNLINDFCPSQTSREADVSILTNGAEQHASWESSVFKFVKATEVYIHCNIRVCFKGDACAKTCNSTTASRGKREVQDFDNVVLSLGPIIPESGVPTVKSLTRSFDDVISTTAASLARKNNDSILGIPRTGVYAIIAVLVFLTMVAFTSAVLCVIRKGRNVKSHDAISTNQNVRQTSTLKQVSESPKVECLI